METRDQWYKPNLLYNIHYRSPKRVESPKMIVETVQFNPSVCTCGEHGCEPKYRMEKRVLWTNKEIVTREQAEKKVKENETDPNTMLTEEKNARNDAHSAEAVRVYDVDHKKLLDKGDKADDYIDDVKNLYDTKWDKFYEKAYNDKNMVDEYNCNCEESSGIGKNDVYNSDECRYGCGSADSETVNATSLLFEHNQKNYNDGKTDTRKNLDSDINFQSHFNGNKRKVFKALNDRSDKLTGICCGNVNMDAVKHGATENGRSHFSTAVTDVGKYAYKDHNSIDVETSTSIGEIERADNDGTSITSCSDTSSIIDNHDNVEWVEVKQDVETLGQLEGSEVPEIPERVNEIASAFGIMTVYCNSELHSWKPIPDQNQS